MPRPPLVSSATENLLPSAPTLLSRRFGDPAKPFFPLQIGDTWLAPPEGCRMGDLVDRSQLHCYAPPEGLPELVDQLLEQTRDKIPGLQRKNLLVTAGATAGITVVLGSLLEPGDEVLILAPHWPLITGIVRAFHGRPIPVPFHGQVSSPEEVLVACRERVNDRTVALYFSSPNNPTGQVMPHLWLEALVTFAAEQNLWLLGDLVFEDLIYEGSKTDPYTLAPDRTFVFRSFSKTFGLAGYRCGYVTGPLHTMGRVRNLGTQLVYGAATASQVAACRALGTAGDKWLARARELYRTTGQQVAERLGISPPEGGIFLFIDLPEQLIDEPMCQPRVIAGAGGEFRAISKIGAYLFYRDTPRENS